MLISKQGTRLMMTLALLFGVPLCFSGCDDDESSAEKDESRSKKKKKRKKKRKATSDASGGVAAPEVAPSARPAPPPEDPDASVKAFWKQQVAACNAYNEKVGNTSPPDKHLPGDENDPSRKISVVKVVQPMIYLIEDAGGNRLIANVRLNHITPPAGADSALPQLYSFCDPAVWLGTMDEEVAPEPEPSAPPPAPVPLPGGSNAGDGLAADGLPVTIPPPGSKAPTPSEINAQPREVTVRGSSALRCETKMVREWLNVRCYANDEGTPTGINMFQTGGVQSYKNVDDGTRATLLMQVVRGRTSKVMFSWDSGRGYENSRVLVVHWPSNADRPTLYFES